MRLQQEFPTGEIEFAAFLHGSNSKPCMSLMGQKQTSRSEITMSALPPKANMVQHDHDVHFVPKADICSVASARGRSIWFSSRRSIAARLVEYLVSNNCIEVGTVRLAGA